MAERQIRRNLAIFPIGIVQKLTDLTPRQIRYYEQHELVNPERTGGNQRLFTLNDLDRLLEIRDLLSSGESLTSIKRLINKPIPSGPELTDQQMRKLLAAEFSQVGRFSTSDSNKK